jgi:YesN/AraC family two-component response regulator
MQYPKIFYSIYESGDVDLNHNEKTVDNAKKNEWEKWKKDILSSHIYRKEGITIYQISQELSMERKQLSYFINTKEKCNFNTFINRLRIEDAQKMVIEHPEYSFFEIALLVGYTDQANFSRKFKETTGVSPSEYKKGLRTNSKE